MKLVVSLCSLVVLSACASTTTTGTATDAGAKPSCEMLAEDCHESTSEVGKACHELGHSASSTEESCKAQMDKCMAACPHSDAGTDGAVATDAATGDGGACKAAGTACTDNSECCSADCHAHSGTMKMCE